MFPTHSEFGEIICEFALLVDTVTGNPKRAQNHAPMQDLCTNISNNVGCPKWQSHHVIPNRNYLSAQQ